MIPKQLIYNLRERGIITCLDVRLAETVVKTSGVKAGLQEILFGVTALLSYWTSGNRHVCFPLPTTKDRSLADLFPDAVSELKQDDELLQALQEATLPISIVDSLRQCSSVVARPHAGKIAFKPLVLDGEDLYLQRYWQYERCVAKRIRKLSEQEKTDVELGISAGAITAVSNHFSAGSTVDWQQAAVFAALRNRFTVITGGPGTGKTTVIATILALMLEGKLKPEKVALCAPTGKAQARLKEAIRDELKYLNCSVAVKEQLKELKTSTIHMLLGVIWGTPRFKHNAERTLDAEVVIVDEVSMVAQPLMAKLLDAVPPKAKLILLGDKDQLASVETGSVLADVYSAASVNGFSPETAEAFRQQFPAVTAELPVASETSALTDTVIELKVSHRFLEGGGIDTLKKAVNKGDAEGAMAALRMDKESVSTDGYAADATPGVLGIPDTRANLQKALAELIKSQTVAVKEADDSVSHHLFADYYKADSLEKAFQKFDGFRILCSNRRGIYGVNAINKLLRKILGRTDAFAKGLPIMITTNDYQHKLFNGDVGLCWPHKTDKGTVLMVHFPDPESPTGFRPFLPGQLPDHEVVYAMTVHKSQGSGFQNVLVITPEKDNPVLTRELLYTAITRAKKHVRIWGAEQTFRAMVGRPTERSSGLKEKLLKEKETMDFVAIDFETAVGKDSACAVGIVCVKDGQVCDEYHQLIQPPGNEYSVYTTRVHGLTAEDTKDAPLFPEVYPEIRRRLHGQLVVAHNEAFDRSVLKKNMQRYGLNYGELGLLTPWECTVRLYRRKGSHPCDLATLSRQHNIDLDHHEALSDARACAQLYLLHLQG